LIKSPASTLRENLDLAVVDGRRSDQLRAEAVAVLKRLNAVVPADEAWQLGGAAEASSVPSSIT
jgi:hypothetical protein